MISNLLSAASSALLRNGLLLAVAGGTVACAVAPLAASMLSLHTCNCDNNGLPTCSGGPLFDSEECEEGTDCVCTLTLCQHTPRHTYGGGSFLAVQSVSASCTDPL